VVVAIIERGRGGRAWQQSNEARIGFPGLSAMLCVMTAAPSVILARQVAQMPERHEKGSSRRPARRLQHRRHRQAPWESCGAAVHGHRDRGENFLRDGCIGALTRISSARVGGRKSLEANRRRAVQTI